MQRSSLKAEKEADLAGFEFSRKQIAAETF